MEQPERARGRVGVGSGRHASACPNLKGNMHRTLVVKDPGGMFSQAIFILKPEARGQEIDRGELLRQARAAAGLMLPEPEGRGHGMISFWIGMLLGVGSTAAVLWMLGMLIIR